MPKSPNKIEEAMRSLWQDLDMLHTNTEQVTEVVDFAKKKVRSLKRTRSKILIKQEDGSHQVHVRDLEQYTLLSREIRHTGNITRVVIEGIFFQIYAVLDAFLRDFCIALLDEKTSLIKNLDLSFSAIQIIENKESIDELINDAMMKYLDDELFGDYENKFSAVFRFSGQKFDTSSCPFWPQLIEGAMRRNVIIHANGRATHRYCEKIAQLKINDAPAKGSILDLRKFYVIEVLKSVEDCCMRMYGYLCQSLLDKESRSQRYELIHDRAYEHLVHGDDGRSKLYTQYLRDLDLKKVPQKDREIRVNLINQALCCKRLGELEEMQQLLKTVDWSASSDDFRRALQALNDEIDHIFQTELSDTAWNEILTWPVFRETRKSDRFISKFEEKFGTPYSEEEV